MSEYKMVFTLHLRAESDRAASAAQLEMFGELRTFLGQGVRTESYEVKPLTGADFADSRLERAENVDLHRGATTEDPPQGGS